MQRKEQGMQSLGVPVDSDLLQDTVHKEYQVQNRLFFRETGLLRVLALQLHLGTVVAQLHGTWVFLVVNCSVHAQVDVIILFTLRLIQMTAFALHVAYHCHISQLDRN
jgi:hypothetical protein